MLLLPFTFASIVPFLSPRTDRAQTRVHASFSRSCSAVADFVRPLTAIQIRKAACGNRPTLNVNCCLDLWQPALRLAAFDSRRRSPPSTGPFHPFHPNNHGYSFRCFTNDPSKRARRLTTFCQARAPPTAEISGSAVRRRRNAFLSLSFPYNLPRIPSFDTPVDNRNLPREAC